MKKQEVIRKNVKEKVQLPAGFDVIDTYKSKTEQNVVDNLFDYFGKVFYQKHKASTTTLPQETTKRVVSWFRINDSKINKFYWLAALMFFLVFAALSSFMFFIGTSVEELQLMIRSWVNDGMLSVTGWNVIFIIALTVVSLLGVLALVFLGFGIKHVIKRSQHIKFACNPEYQMVDYDGYLYLDTKWKITRSITWTVIFALISLGSLITFFVMIGSDHSSVLAKITEYASKTPIDLEGWKGLVYSMFIFFGLAVIATILFGINALTLISYRKQLRLTRRGLLGEEKSVRNHAVTRYDTKLFNYLTSKIGGSGIASASFLLLAVAIITTFLLIFGTDYNSVIINITKWVKQGALNESTWEIISILLLSLAGVFIIVGLSFLINSFLWLSKKGRERSRVATRVEVWNENYVDFTSRLTKEGILNSIQSGMSDLILDKVTPTFDRKLFNTHSRIYSYCNIPEDAKKIGFQNTLSGFYKGAAFSLSASSWEWYREAKIVNQFDNSYESDVRISRSLKRYEDNICILAIDTFAEPNLNFVLNNPEGRNIKIQNEIFNKIFSLAVNNPKIAYTVFTPFVQHTFTRCKTWAQPGKAIRQVIKEGTKIYVVFDGKADFFSFDKITNPELNKIFSYEDDYAKYLLENVKSGRDRRFLSSFGSLDQTATLMTEYVLEELDVLFTALEMGTCLPHDNSLREKTKAKSLYDILNEKRQSYNAENFKLDVSNAKNRDNQAADPNTHANF